MADLAVVEAFAKEMMGEWGLDDWKFEWMSTRSLFGQAAYGPKLIRLSRQLIAANSMAEAEDVTLHEIAHALAWLETRERGHGSQWRRWCRIVGARPNATYGEEVTVEYRWHGVCPACKEVRAKRQELGKQFLAKGGQSCGACSTVYDARFVLEWIDGRTTIA